MKSTPLMRLVVAGATGVVAALAVLGIVVAVNAEKGFVGCTATTGLGWLVPVISGFVALGLAWGLSRSARRRGGASSSARQECAVCGGTVLGDWRMCPHCGELFADRPDDGLCS